MKKKISPLQFILTMIFIVFLLISNLTASKEIVLWGNIEATAAILIFPFTYILSDIFSEIYGYKWSRITCYLAFGMNLFMVLFLQLSILIPSPEHSLNEEAFKMIFSNTPRVLIGSLSAFVFGDLVNDKIFAKMKSKHKDDHRGFGLRAILSSICGEITDSLIFFPIVFWGVLDLEIMLIIFATELCIKVLYEILVLPLTHFLVRRVSKYEKKFELCN